MDILDFLNQSTHINAIKDHKNCVKEKAKA